MSSGGEHLAPVCPVHPYGYHRRARVRERGDRVLSEASAVVLPSRCATLEREVDDADRVEDFRRQLWVMERTGHGGAAAGALSGVLVALCIVMGYPTVTTGGLTLGIVAAAIAAAIASAAAVMKVGSRIHEARLRRVYEWREYVGFHI